MVAISFGHDIIRTLKMATFFAFIHAILLVGFFAFINYVKKLAPYQPPAKKVIPLCIFKTNSIKKRFDAEII